MSDTPTPTPAAAAPPAKKEHVRCYCARCRMRSLMAPVLVITAGFLFLIDQVPGVRFGQLWPVFMIVVGVMLLLRSSASVEGHRG